MENPINQNDSKWMMTGGSPIKTGHLHSSINIINVFHGAAIFHGDGGFPEDVTPKKDVPPALLRDTDYS